MQEYEAFVEWASGKEFDHRSATKVEFDKVLALAKRESVYSGTKKEMEELGALLDKSKSEVLNENREEIKSLLEEEIINRYYYQRGRAEIMLRNDIQFDKAKEAALLN